ncbi:transcriptional regulator [Formosa sediminum]|uniref:Transcriptional regulator n=1 Tax=Formosa sediminum TaxID=2594004 RepID=A0A516GUC0_9FLAO|nr:transcriptional regulator [Formosa sediminum]QDO95124.1 transcriptional regulator [Formosa sediminum]
MTSILTGDIINSRAHDAKNWLPQLKTELNLYGESPKYWEIYRGDSFQLEVAPAEALKAAILIKASLKQLKTIDVRIAIGIGEKTYNANHITESNGSAFINSGECFEQLKKTNLAIKSSQTEFDTAMNIMLELALLTMNTWTPTSAALVKLALTHPDANQKMLAKQTQSTQGNISQGLKRAGYDEILKMIAYYSKYVTL